MIKVSLQNWNGIYLRHSFKQIKRKRDKTLHSNLLIAKILDSVPERDKNRYLEVSRSWFLTSLASKEI